MQVLHDRGDAVWIANHIVLPCSFVLRVVNNTCAGEGESEPGGRELRLRGWAIRAAGRVHHAAAAESCLGGLTLGRNDMVGRPGS